MSDHNFETLKEHVLSLSVSKNWSDAKNEWKLVGIEYQEDWDECPCGKEIKELCILENHLNNNKTHVGNVCVNRFIGIETGNLFDGLRRIMEDDSANANEDLIMHAYKMGYIYNENEYKFLMQTRRKRVLSLAQLAWKQKINRRIVNATVVRNQ